MTDRLDSVQKLTQLLHCLLIFQYPLASALTLRFRSDLQVPVLERELSYAFVPSCCGVSGPPGLATGFLRARLLFLATVIPMRVAEMAAGRRIAGGINPVFCPGYSRE